jgi:cytochrome P450
MRSNNGVTRIYECNSNVFNSNVPLFMIKSELSGRDAIIRELTSYFSNEYDSQPDVSPLIRSHAKLFREQGLSNEDVARIHFATIYAALSNTFPTFFFTIMHIFTDPNLVEKLRHEAQNIVRKNGHEATVDISDIEGKCQLLTSVYRESFRIHVGSPMIRKPLVDTYVSDGERSYLLKKDKVVMLRIPAMHHTSEIWGTAIDSFDSERFLKPETERARKKAFSPFGGGKHLCPGRNFASAEIMGVALALTLGFEITSAHGDHMKFPNLKATQLTHIFGRTKKGEDLRACISRRQGWENVQWKFV